MNDWVDSRTMVQAAATGDREALGALLQQHLPALQGWIRLRMGAKLRARETPADLVQSVALEVLAELDQFEWRGEAAFRHWLYAHAEHKLLQHARFVGAQRRDPDREQTLDPEASQGVLDCYQYLCTPSRLLAADEAVARIESVIDELPDEQREAISLKRFCGMDYAEIAARMERSEGAVRNLVYRGLSKLAVRLGAP